MAVRDDVSLLEVQLSTKRSYRIHAQLVAIGYPILGDPKYGDPTENTRLVERLDIRYQPLHVPQVQLLEEAGVFSALHRRGIFASPPDPFHRLFPGAF